MFWWPSATSNPYSIFQDAALHRLGGSRKGGAVGHCHEFVLCCLPRLCVKGCGLREAREQKEGEGARSSGEYSQFVSAGEANTWGRYIRASCGRFGDRYSGICCRGR